MCAKNMSSAITASFSGSNIETFQTPMKECCLNEKMFSSVSNIKLKWSVKYCSTLVDHLVYVERPECFYMFVENEEDHYRVCWARFCIVSMRLIIQHSVSWRWFWSVAKHFNDLQSETLSNTSSVRFVGGSRQNSNGMTPYGGDKCRWGE